MKDGSDLKGPAQKIDPLTSIRFFGAVYIVACHWWRMGVPIVLHSSLLLRFLFLGSSGVSGFYLLSGFILAWVYLSEGSRLDKRQFYISRFARVYPIFLLTLIADTPWFYLSQIARLGVKGALIKTGLSFAGCLVMVQAWGPRFWAMDFPNWSLSVETLSYALFPFVGLLLWRLRGVWIWVAMLALYAGGQVVVALALIFAASHHISSEVVFFFPPLHVSTFLLGVLVARLQASSSGRGPTRQRSAGVVYSVLGMTITAYVVTVLITTTSMVGFPPGSAFVRDGMLAPVFCGLVWSLSNENTLVSRWLSARWLVVLGEASYGLYLIHVPVLHMILPLLLRLSNGLTWQGFRSFYVLSFLGYLVVCIGLSVASFYWVEAPARRWIKSKFRPNRKKTVTSASASAAATVTPYRIAGGN
jgi:peptidoglycan/LPS O-acetylase OafA/YrhL